MIFLTEITEDDNTGLEIASTTSRYRKLTVENKNAMDFTEGSSGVVVSYLILYCGN